MPIYSLGKKIPSLPSGDDYWVAPNAVLLGDVRLQCNASVWFGAVLRGDNAPLIIGAGSNVQDNSVMHTHEGVPLQIGENVTIGHAAVIHGATIGDGSLIGIGAVILDGAHIGKGCIVGAGALVTEGTVIPDGSLAIGRPAQVIRQLTAQEQEALLEGASHYIRNWRRFKAILKQIV
jgi:carbonic anhydrase/acetyltransferase-like protein (isoleucine patch superfamily)